MSRRGDLSWPAAVPETDDPILSFWDEDARQIEYSEVLAMDADDETPDPFNMEELLQAQSEDGFCKSKAEMVGYPKSDYDYDRYGILVRKSKLDGTQQRVVPVTLCARLLHMSHYPTLAGHPGGIRMYYTLRRE